MRQQTLGNLERDGVDVEAFQTVHARRRRERDQVRGVEGTKTEQVEDRPEVHEERVVALTRKHQ